MDSRGNARRSAAAAELLPPPPPSPPKRSRSGAVPPAQKRAAGRNPPARKASVPHVKKLKVCRPLSPARVVSREAAAQRAADHVVEAAAVDAVTAAPVATHAPVTHPWFVALEGAATWDVLPRYRALQHWFEWLGGGGKARPFVDASQLSRVCLDSGCCFTAAGCERLASLVAGRRTLTRAEFCLWILLANAVARAAFEVTHGAFPCASVSILSEVARALGVRDGLCGGLPTGFDGSAEHVVLAVLEHVRRLPACEVAALFFEPQGSLCATEEVPEAEQELSLGFSAEDYTLLRRMAKAHSAELSEPDKVTVKEAWNKALAWKDMMIEAAIMHWVSLIGGEEVATQLLGPFFDELQNVLFRVLDLCVRSLQPETEVIAREAYRGVHPVKGSVLQTPCEYFAHFAEVGLRPTHWVQLKAAFLFAMKGFVPYMEDEEMDDFAREERGAVARFFEGHLVYPAINAIRKLRQFLCSDEVLVAVPQHWASLGLHRASGRLELSERFHKACGEHDMLREYLSTPEQAKSYVESVLAASAAARFLPQLRSALTNLGQSYRNTYMPSYAHAVATSVLLRTMNTIKKPASNVLWAQCKIVQLTVKFVQRPAEVEEEVYKRAETFCTMVAKEKRWAPDALAQRMTQIRSEVHATGTYTHTHEELEVGSREAWRNSAKCIGRISWNTLLLRDSRHISDEDAVFQDCIDHIKAATGGPTIQSVMTVYAPRSRGTLKGSRIWNGQLYSYACYRQEDGSLLGDPVNLTLTESIQKTFGWEPSTGTRTRFDVLPLVIEMEGRAPKLYEWPKEYIFSVDLEHPENPGFKELGLKWMTVPAISSFRMTLGGVDYCMQPFNGWFMDMEIARNLCERYKVGPDVARVFGISTEGVTMWQDRVYLEVYRAVHHSFVKNQFTIVDHHTASRQYSVHCQREKMLGREVPAQWSWIGGLAGPTASVWHHEMRDFHVDPQYSYQAPAYYVSDPRLYSAAADVDGVESTGSTEADGPKQIAVLFGSETGTSESFARRLAKSLKSHDVTLASLNDYDGRWRDLEGCAYVLVVTSTFNDGGKPSNASKFPEKLPAKLKGVKFAVLAVGSSAYENFCAFGHAVDQALTNAGGDRMFPTAVADELQGQYTSFLAWQGTAVETIGVAADTHTRKPEYGVEMVPAAGGGDGRIPKHHRLRVLENVDLVKPGPDTVGRSVRQVTLSLEGDDGPVATYETGDHICVRPRTSDDVVNLFCGILDPPVSPQASFRAYEIRGGKQVAQDLPFPDGTSVAQAVGFYLSLRLEEGYVAPVLEALRARAAALSKGDAEAAVDEMLEALEVSEDDFLRRFSELPTLLSYFQGTFGVSLGLADVWHLLPTQRGRFYSISTPSDLSPTRVSITVSVIGGAAPGLCSNYLAGLMRGDHIHAFLKTSSFRCPTDSPVLAVATGVGIAPFVAMFDSRTAQDSVARSQAVYQSPASTPAASAASEKFRSLDTPSVGPAAVYYGCRGENDLLYSETYHKWTGVDMSVAFSRMSGQPKTYVQDLLQRSSHLAKMLMHPKCNFMYCGSHAVAEACHSQLLSCLQRECGMTKLAAVHHLDIMRGEKRYQLDVWGAVRQWEEHKALLTEHEATGVQVRTELNLACQANSFRRRRNL